MSKTIKNTCILGCGLIGESWGALFLAHGFHIHAWDPDPGVRAYYADRLQRPLEQLSQVLGKPMLDAQAITAKLTIHETLASAVANADFIQENAPRENPVKTRHLRRN
ncbi:3-hydroxyacyl-CoA dehydrogenase NAD-binding domain-containing protein [Marinomonas sp.]|uniref:3-hydroxyacyl-CoA dehydrogenase NAD-binding domain-containing protein n=1 Tax=Marinomonas sp. TaxID=1904862 RepID=UPI003BAC49EB